MLAVLYDFMASWIHRWISIGEIDKHPDFYLPGCINSDLDILKETYRLTISSQISDPDIVGGFNHQPVVFSQDFLDAAEFQIVFHGNI